MSRLANIVIASAVASRANALAEILSEHNCNILACDTAEDFLAEVRAGRPDLVMIDVGSEALDGFTLARVLREHDDAIPTVLTAADNAADLFIEALAAGIDEVVVGPVHPIDLIDRLRPLFRLATLRTELRRRRRLALDLGMTETALADPAPADDRFRVLVADGASGAAEEVAAALDDRWAVESSPNAIATRDLLYDEPFDAAVIGVADESGRRYALELSAQVRNNPRLFNVPLVVLAEPAAFPNPADALEHGASRMLLRPVERAELRFVLTVLGHRQRERWRIREAIEATRGESTCDAVTGCYSLAFLRRHLDALIAAAHRWQKHLTVIVFTAPTVAEIRSVHGERAARHLEGQIAQWIAALVRLEDVTARDDGGAFIVALPDTSLDEAEVVVHRVAGILDYTDFAIADVFRPVAVSVDTGAAELEPEDTVESLLARARAGPE